MCEKSKKGFIIEALEKSGYPLELYIRGVFQSRGWSVFPNQFFFDKDSGKGREYDLRVEKEIIIDDIGALLFFRILIECKKILGNAWIFFEGPYERDTQFFSLPKIVSLLDGFEIDPKEAYDVIIESIIFKEFHYDEGFLSSGYKEIVLDRKKSTKSKISNIWDAEITLIKTLDSEKQDCLSHELMKGQIDEFQVEGIQSWFYSGAEQCLFFLYPLIIFEGELYSTKLPLIEENMNETKYVKLLRDYKSTYYNFNGTIDIITKDYIEKYIDNLNNDIDVIIDSIKNNWVSFVNKERELLFYYNAR